MQKMKFINFFVDQKLPQKLVLKHLSYVVLWILGIAIFLFRLDTLLYSSLYLTSFKKRNNNCYLGLNRQKQTAHIRVAAMPAQEVQLAGGF